MALPEELDEELNLASHDVLPHPDYTIADAAVQERHIDDGAVTETKLADRAVTNVKVALASIDASLIAAQGIESENIADYAVLANKMNLKHHLIF